MLGFLGLFSKGCWQVPGPRSQLELPKPLTGAWAAAPVPHIHPRRCCGQSSARGWAQRTGCAQRTGVRELWEPQAGSSCTNCPSERPRPHVQAGTEMEGTRGDPRIYRSVFLPIILRQCRDCSSLAPGAILVCTGWAGSSKGICCSHPCAPTLCSATGIHVQCGMRNG